MMKKSKVFLIALDFLSYFSNKAKKISGDVESNVSKRAKYSSGVEPTEVVISFSALYITGSFKKL